jgi:hypothetical protein
MELGANAPSGKLLVRLGFCLYFSPQLPDFASPWLLVGS